MISRPQRVLFWILLVCCIVMSILLLHLRQRAHERIQDAAAKMPLNPPAEAAAENVTMMIANDDTGMIAPIHQKIALPTDANARARVILQRLVADYARPNSSHPIGPNSGVNQVFFMALPAQGDSPSPGSMAVIDLSGSFAAAHPSGIETETLTLLSIIGTLHASFPNVKQVRFLIDGEPRDTLAGHADLRRIYLASESPARL